MRRARVVLSAVAATAVLGGTALLTADRDPVLLPAGPAAPADCAFFRVNSSGLGLSTLTSIDLATGAVTRVRTLDHRVDALGYADGRLYALAASGRDGVHLPSRLITMDTAGTVLSSRPLVGTILGGLVIRGGAVANGHFYAIAGATLLSIRLSDAVVDGRVLLSLLPGLTVDDLAYRPTDGRLYGVSTPLLLPGPGRAVRINSATGAVTPTDQSPLPSSTSYGSIVLAPDGALYPISNRTDGRSRVYRLPFTANGGHTETLVLPPTDSADASECVPRPAPPTTTPPPPATTRPPVPPPPGRPTPPPTTTTTPAPGAPPPIPGAPPVPGQPVVPPPPPGVPSAPAVPPPAPSPVPAPQAPPSRVRQAEAEEPVPTPKERAHEATEKKRKWGLTALVLLLGAGAAAASSRGGRHR